MLHPVPGLLEHTTPGFREKLVAMCSRLEADPTALAAVMAFETGKTFRSDIQNPSSGATGLIQFLPSTARSLGTTVDELKRLTPEAQLAWVEKYFRTRGAVGKLRTVADHYMAVFAPAFIGAPDSAVLYRQGGDAYRLNKPLDTSKDGTITKAEAARFVISFYNTAKGLAPVSGEAPKSDSLAPFPAGRELASLDDLRDVVLAELADLRHVVELRCDELDGRMNSLLEETAALRAELELKG